MKAIHREQWCIVCMSVNKDSEYIGEAAKLSANAALTLFLGDFTYNLILALGSIAIARILGSEGYGVFSLALIPPQTLALLTSLGIDIGVARYIQRYSIEKQYRQIIQIVKASILLRVAIGIIGTTICYFYSETLSSILVNRPGIGGLVKVTAIVVFLQLIYNLLLNVFIGFNSFQATSIMKITYSVFKTTISIILLLLGFGVIGALFGNILGYTASILPAAILVYRNIKQVNQYNTSNNGVDLYTLIVLLKYSLPLYMGSLTGIILSIYQNVLLSYSLSEVYIGGYRAMYNFMGLISIITTPISLALLPFFTRFDDSVKEKLDKALNMANKYIALIIIPITVISMVFSKELMYILYGREYMFTSIYLPLLFAPNLLAGLGSIAIPTMFNGIGVTRYNMYLSITNALVFIPTSYLLTYRFNYGLWGFLTSTLFSSIITTALAIYLSKKFVYDPINIKLIGGFYIASIISIIPIIPVFYIHVPRLITLIRLLVGGIIYLLIYIGIAIVLNCINKDDVDFIANTFKNYPIINVFLKVFVKYANLILRLVDREKRL